ncbi:MAG: hypothetical protein AAFN80_04565 [Pseudomonadota bacterium]
MTLPYRVVLIKAYRLVRIRKGTALMFHGICIRSACTMLAVIQCVMLTSLYFGIEPHPPRATPLFAMAPFLAVSIGIALCAIQQAGTSAGTVFAVASATTALISFGPQKYFDAAFSEIWIAVLAAQIAIFAIFFTTFGAYKKRSA